MGLFPLCYNPVTAVVFLPFFPPWGQRKRTSAVELGFEVNVRWELEITWEGLLPGQLRLTGTTTLVNELFTKDTRTNTHTPPSTRHIDTSPFLDMNCCHCLDNAFFWTEGKSSLIMTGRKTSWWLILSYSPSSITHLLLLCWLFISNSWVASWEICEWTVRPVLLSAIADFRPLQDYETQ